MLAAVAAALLPQASGAATKTIDLRREYDFRADIDLLTMVAPAGDVNDDGHSDVLYASPGADHNDRSFSGSVRVVFGPFEAGSVTEEQLTGRGFRIDGAESEDTLGSDAAGLGDVNGDGLDDVVVGADGADHNGRSLSGSAYVVFGKESTDNVDLKDFDLGTHGTAGYRIDGAGGLSLIGRFIDDTGDINGDGLNDMILGSVLGDTAYVVFGKADPAPIDLRDFHFDTQGAHGYRIDHPGPPDTSNYGYGVAGVGDVNGDGTADVYVDACRPNRRQTGCGKRTAWVVWGKADPAPVDVRDLGGKGFAIKGSRDGSGLALKPGRPGDLNHDGLADLVVIHGYGSPNNAYVIFGKKGSKPIDPAELGKRGYKIKGWTDNDPYELDELTTTAAAGDIDGDHTNDVLLGASSASPRKKNAAGVAFVLFGKRNGGRVIKLANLGEDGYRIIQPRRLSIIGRYLAGSSDVNGDRVPDVLMTSYSGPYELYISWGRHP